MRVSEAGDTGNGSTNSVSFPMQDIASGEPIVIGDGGGDGSGIGTGAGSGARKRARVGSSS